MLSLKYTAAMPTNNRRKEERNSAANRSIKQAVELMALQNKCMFSLEFILEIMIKNLSFKNGISEVL